jgi:HD-like signal output (HDOD) protein
VASIIQEDIAMTAKILQLANSAFFGLAQKVTSLSTAVNYLGMETTKNLALTSEVFRAFAGNSRIPQSVCESMEKHAQSVAFIAALLPVEPSMRDTVAIAALLHDIGCLFLASSMPDAFCAVQARAKERACEQFEAEEEILGTSHAEIGAYLMGLWGIPNIAVEAIAHHHRPTRAPQAGLGCTAAIYIANLLAHEMDDHPQRTTELTIKESDRTNLETLGLLSRMDEFRDIVRRSRT